MSQFPILFIFQRDANAISVVPILNAKQMEKEAIVERVRTFDGKVLTISLTEIELVPKYKEMIHRLADQFRKSGLVGQNENLILEALKILVWVPEPVSPRFVVDPEGDWYESPSYGNDECANC